MGAWGYGFFQDDLAADVRMVYERALRDGATDQEASARVLEQFSAYLADADESPVVEIALAVTQWNWGRPDPAAVARAIALIDRGATLPRWQDEGPAAAGKHAAALRKIRRELLQPARARRAARAMPPNPFALGDFVEVRLPSGKLGAIRIVQAKEGRSAGDLSLVVLTAYAFHGDLWPGTERLEQLGLLPNSEFGQHESNALPPVAWMVFGGRAPRTIYTVRERGGRAFSAAEIGNPGVALWRHVPSRLETILVAQKL